MPRGLRCARVAGDEPRARRVDARRRETGRGGAGRAARHSRAVREDEGMTSTTDGADGRSTEGTAPERATVVLGALILVAARRQPQPLRRQRRPPRHRGGVRLVADDAQPDRGRLLARSRRVGALVRRPGRPLRPQADDRARDGPLDPGLAPCRVRAFRRGALPRARRRRAGRRHGLSHDARARHGALVGAGPDEGDRALVRARRRDRRARPARLGPAARAFRLGIRLRRDRAPRGACPAARDQTRPGPRERVDRAGRQPRRRPLRAPRRRARRRDQLLAGAERDDARPRPCSPSHSSAASCSSCASAGPRTRSTTSGSPRARRSGWRDAPGSSSSAR